MEALVLETEWIRFFDEQLLKEAERKLKGAGYRYVRYVAAESSERLPADVLKKATPEYIWKSVQLFHSGDVSHAFGSSTKYDLIAENGKRFAPKAVFGVALSMAFNGAAIEPKHFSGDEASLCFALLRDAGYQIVPKDSDSPSSDPASMPEQEWMEGDRKLCSRISGESSPPDWQKLKRRSLGVFTESSPASVASWIQLPHSELSMRKLVSKSITRQLTSARWGPNTKRRSMTCNVCAQTAIDFCIDFCERKTKCMPTKIRDDFPSDRMHVGSRSALPLHHMNTAAH